MIYKSYTNTKHTSQRNQKTQTDEPHVNREQNRETKDSKQRTFIIRSITSTDGNVSDSGAHGGDTMQSQRSRTHDQRSPRSDMSATGSLGGSGGGGGRDDCGGGREDGGSGGSGGGSGAGGCEVDRFGTGMGKKSSSTSQLSATGNTTAGNYLLQYFLYLL